MLKYLHIENIAVIEEANIEFQKGFNVLTGETGAGKSIVIDAINAVLGERTSKELIRSGCKNAVVSAVFGSISENVKEIIAQKGFLPDDDGNYIIQRVLSAGSSSLRINGQPVSASLLREFSGNLINIHGQHDNQALLDPDNHYMYIDNLAENSEEKQQYITEFNNFNSLRSRIKKLDMDEDEKYRKIDLLNYQINELENADIKIGELELLKEKSGVARNAEKKIKELEGALVILNGSKNNDEDNGVLDSLFELCRILDKDSSKELGNESAVVNNAIDSLAVLRDKIADFKEALSSDTYDFESIQDRIETLNTLMRKYGDTEEKMLSFLENAKIELENIRFNEKELENLETELVDSQQRLINKAEVLTATRKKTAAAFESSVCEVLGQLNMPNVRLTVEINKGRYTKNGCDEIQFLICTNVGEDSKPLSKIASGGELSRVMLAIKSVLAEKDDVDTLIFDEIDTGISGKAADKVGIQLKKVADSRQVICVTHLAQIAVTAANHFLIQKNVNNGRTYTDITALDGEERVKEIARIMGGQQISDTLMASAKEMLNYGSK